ncbi:hypothetical protein C1646_772759 [Rhizophagus diaphanus]|nr:hypothetical protein C1646_772759 [Rhizophagus diaphanus] [Rhizophagus sp. MUCL 43196]
MAVDIVYLRVKAFIPVDENIPCQIKDFDKGQVIFLKGKFVVCASWYSVNATSVKLIDNMGFDDIPAIRLNVMIMGLTTKTIRNVDNQLIIEFYVEENLGDREPREFWVEMPVLDESSGEETSPGKHILILDNISLISTNRNPTVDAQQSSNAPWLNSRTNNRNQWTAHGASPRTSKRGRGTLSQMRLRSSTLALTLDSNPMPTMINENQ